MKTPWCRGTKRLETYPRTMVAMNRDAGDLAGGVDRRRHRDLGAFIREQRRIGRLSLRKLSERAGISNPYLSQIERGLRKPSAEILQRIARALEISSETLYVRAGILEERGEKADVASAIRHDPHLTEEHKRTLLHLYWSFRGGDRGDRPGEPVAPETARRGSVPGPRPD